MIKASNEKVLLVLLPFWDPQIPPLGISCLKSFLQPPIVQPSFLPVVYVDGYTIQSYHIGFSR